MRINKIFFSLSRQYKLAFLKLRMFGKRNPTGDIEKLNSFTVRINDGPNFYICYRDIFINRIYHFEVTKETPVILDCGSNIGMSIMYFKKIYPSARITGFEADRSILPFLKENMKMNLVCDDVNIVEAALGVNNGEMTFYSDKKYGSTLIGESHKASEGDRDIYSVRTVSLTDYLYEQVDFMKMNIEGAEWPVLDSAADKLRNINEMIIEYHHLPGLQRNLHNILRLLHDQGFEYLVYDFDRIINPELIPPFRLNQQTRYFLLIYAKRTI